MAAKVTCPKCDASLRIRDASPGKKLRCPKCQKVFEIPADDQPEPVDVVEEVDDDEADEKAPRSRWQPCPRCDSQRVKRVMWTVWGSFYGAALLSHVRCQKCRYAYNGRSGRSNFIPAILFVSVPLAVIGGILTWVFFILKERGVF